MQVRLAASAAVKNQCVCLHIDSPTQRLSRYPNSGGVPWKRALQGRGRAAAGRAVYRRRPATGAPSLFAPLAPSPALAPAAQCFFHVALFQVISQRDIAIYAGLLALATFTRDELREKIAVNVCVSRRRANLFAPSGGLGSQRTFFPAHSPGRDFKPFLDLAPQVRQLIKAFQASEYAQSLALLEKLKVRG